MKKLLSFICLFSIIYFSSQAQKKETITVRAGTRVLDNFPLKDRYLYSDFTSGRVVLKNNLYSDRLLNYNFLLGEVEFIQGRDTLSINNKKDIRYALVARDTFYFDKNYIRQLRGGKIKLGLRECFELKEIQNKDSYGIASSGAATTSYGSMPLDGNFYKLTANKDMIFEKTRQYFLNSGGSGFFLITRKNLIQTFPDRENEIKAFLKTNRIRFDSQEDMSKLSDFLNGFNKH